MSDAQNPNGRQDSEAIEGGVLAALPRARPQRASPRRAAAREAAVVKRGATGAKRAVADGKNASDKSAVRATGKSVTRTAGKSTARTTDKSTARATGKSTARATNKSATNARAKPSAAARRATKPLPPQVPKQGYEPEEEVEMGNTINPPSSVELVESVLDIVGEMANSSISAGGRLVKDVLSLLRRP